MKKCISCNNTPEIGKDGIQYDCCNFCTRAMIADVLKRQSRGKILY